MTPHHCRPHDGPTPAAPLAAVALLTIGVWLPLSWLALGYADASYGAAANVVFGLALLGAVGLQLADDRPPLALRTLTVWIGLLLVVAPIVVRAGEQGPSAAAYVNTMLCGALVAGLGLWTSRRDRRDGPTGD